MLSAVLDYPAEFVVTPKSLKDHFVYIKVYPETTLNDVIDLWNGSFKHIKRKYFKCDNKKIERKINLKRDLEILKLKRNGMRNNNIVEFINERYESSPINFDYIRKLVRRLKNGTT